jgi:hypothetical protein
VGKVVGLELGLVAVWGDGEWGGHYAGVVDEAI